jgi:hypothetical protein
VNLGEWLNKRISNLEAGKAEDKAR